MCINVPLPYQLLIFIIVSVGCFGGLSKYLSLYFDNQIKNKYEYLLYVSKGIGASMLVPLALKILGSDIVTNIINNSKNNSGVNYDPINYLVFAGFCFTAGYFSDSIINLMGDKVLNELKSTKNKLIEVEQQTQKNKDINEAFIGSEIEPEIKIDLQEVNKFKEGIEMLKVFNTFQYRFTPIHDIIKDPQNGAITMEILKKLKDWKLIKSITLDSGTQAWGLTLFGRTFTKKLLLDNTDQ